MLAQRGPSIRRSRVKYARAKIHSCVSLSPSSCFACCFRLADPRVHSSCRRKQTARGSPIPTNKTRRHVRVSQRPAERRHGARIRHWRGRSAGGDVGRRLHHVHEFRLQQPAAAGGSHARQGKYAANPQLLAPPRGTFCLAAPFALNCACFPDDVPSRLRHRIWDASATYEESQRPPRQPNSPG